MNYQRTIALSNDEIKKSMETAQAIFMQNGFAMTKKGEWDFEFNGPGMHSTKQNPLLGVSRARLKLSGRQLKLEADLGSVRRMQWFILIFPFALGLFIFLLIGAAQKNIQSGLPVLAAVAPWIVIAPWMSRWMKRRTVRALDTLLENVAQISR